jgi:vacuolar-type H+-ATPase subunit H
MEKLDQILHAEDDARTAVTTARADSQRLVSDARTTATETLRAGRERLRVAVAERRDGIVARARLEAAAFADAAASECEVTLAAAEARTDAAVAAVLEVLKGR